MSTRNEEPRYTCSLEIEGYDPDERHKDPRVDVALQFMGDFMDPGARWYVRVRDETDPADSGFLYDLEEYVPREGDR